MIQLPPPRSNGHSSLEQTIGRRRSVREYDPGELSLADLGRLLWAGQGITAADGRRTAPSANATYPVELWVAGGRVADLPAGVCRYEPDGHALEIRQRGDVRPSLADAAIGSQPWIGDAAAVIVMAGRLEQAIHAFRQQPPGDRGERYTCIEAGAIAQNIALQATSLGLGAVLVGGYGDDPVQRACGMPPDTCPLAMLCLGHPGDR